MKLRIPQKWKDITSFDDLISPRERDIVHDLESRANNVQCPHLKRIGMYFFYCGLGDARQYTSSERPSPNHPVLQAKVGVIEQQIWCRSWTGHQCCAYYQNPCQEMVDR